MVQWRRRRKQNVDSDVEKEMDDDGHRPFRDEILKTLDDNEGLHTRMSMDSEAFVYTHRTAYRSVAPTILAGYKGKLETCASEANPKILATATHFRLLGIFVRFVVVFCGKAGSYTLLRRNRHRCRTWRCVRRDRRCLVTRRYISPFVGRG